MTNKQSDLLNKWRNKAKLKKSVYYETVKTYNGCNSLLGWLAIILAAIGGTGSITGLANIENYSWIPEMIMLTAALSIATQKFFAFNDKIDSHKMASNGYFIIENGIDIFLTKTNLTNEEIESALARFNENIIELQKSAPVVSQIFWNRQIKRNKKYLELSKNSGLEDEKNH